MAHKENKSPRGMRARPPHRSPGKHRHTVHQPPEYGMNFDRAMDQKYVDTVRACKTILRNLDALEESITYGQREELTRLLERLDERLAQYFAEQENEEGLWVGEE